MMILYYDPPDLKLPWSATEELDRRFGKILRIAILAYLIVSILIPLIPLPAPDRAETEKLPDNLTKLTLQEQPLPKPKIAEIKPPPKPEKPPAPKAQKPKNKTPQKQTRTAAQLNQAAREKAQVSGLLQFQDDLQSMRDLADLNLVKTQDLTRSDARAEQLDRSLLTQKAASQSGGIRTEKVSRDTGGVALSGKTNTRVASDLSLPGGTGSQERYAERRASSTGQLPNRSEEEIRRVIDANKSAIFSIYNRALRGNPALQGKVVIRLIIAASGDILGAELISSQLRAPELEQKLLTRIRLIQFSSGQYAETTVNQTFDFLPY